MKWQYIQESFTVVAAMSKASSNFSEALCEAGIVDVVLNILCDADIQEAYMRNKVHNFPQENSSNKRQFGNVCLLICVS